MMFQVKNRWSGAVQFECDLSAEVAGASYSVQLGFAVQKAVADRASLVGARLDRARLDGASLNGADLTGANLAGASLTDANLKSWNTNKARQMAAGPALRAALAAVLPLVPEMDAPGNAAVVAAKLLLEQVP